MCVFIVLYTASYVLAYDRVIVHREAVGDVKPSHLHANTRVYVLIVFVVLFVCALHVCGERVRRRKSKKHTLVKFARARACVCVCVVFTDLQYSLSQ